MNRNLWNYVWLSGLINVSETIWYNIVYVLRTVLRPV